MKRGICKNVDSPARGSSMSANTALDAENRRAMRTDYETALGRTAMTLSRMPLRPITKIWPFSPKNCARAKKLPPGPVGPTDSTIKQIRQDTSRDDDLSATV